MGFGNMRPPDAGSMGRAMAIFFVSNLLIAWVLAHSIEGMASLVVGADAGRGAMDLRAQCGGLQLAWLLPAVQMNRVAWEMKSWGLVLINASFDLTRLLLFGFICCLAVLDSDPQGYDSSIERRS